ncbi:MAG TPA: HEAT repeat domain-containing protein [Methanocella sp.]|nr:HEAT repeat domain-containing protein [Methanocella sp.]
MSLNSKEKQLLKIIWDFTLPDLERCTAIKELGGGGNQDLSITFLELLKYKHSDDVKIEIVRALGNVGDRRAYSKLKILENRSERTEMKIEIDRAMTKLINENRNIMYQRKMPIDKYLIYKPLTKDELEQKDVNYDRDIKSIYEDYKKQPAILYIP